MVSKLINFLRNYFVVIAWLLRFPTTIKKKHAFIENNATCTQTGYSSRYCKMYKKLSESIILNLLIASSLLSNYYCFDVDKKKIVAKYVCF